MGLEETHGSAAQELLKDGVQWLQLSSQAFISSQKILGQCQMKRAIVRLADGAHPLAAMS